jgi:hypothetical protein
MKRAVPLILLSLLFLASSAWTAGRKSVAVVPSNGRPVTIVIAGKEKDYYLVGKKAPVKFQVDGPGKLVVMSRLKLPAASTGVEKYTLVLKDGGRVLKSQSTQTDKSDAAFNGAEGVPGKSRKFVVAIPEGSFSYELWLDDTPLEAAVKIQLQPAKGQKLVALEPLSYDRIVTANVKENRLVYYVGSKTRPVQLRVVGPATLTVSVRLNYDVTMKGKQKFSVVVQEGANLVKQVPLIATKSTGLSYEEWKDVVPGKSDDLMLSVPKGEHVYKFSPGETAGQSIALRFSIPKKALSNE